MDREYVLVEELREKVFIPGTFTCRSTFSRGSVV
jgi:hypothetical protein